MNDRTCVSMRRETYDRLKMMGYTGESFDLVINRLLDMVKEK